MEAHDLAAMRLAIATLESDPELHNTIETLLRDRGEQEAGVWAVGLLQTKNLKLKPWECPPCDCFNVAAPSDVYGCRPSELRLLQRMLAAGVSRYDPNPMQALAALERAA
jgi:hypothetical protein